MILGYRWNRLFEPILVAGSKLLLTEFGILHILESCDGDSLISRCQVPTSFNSPQNVPNKSLISASSQTCLCAILTFLWHQMKVKAKTDKKRVLSRTISTVRKVFTMPHWWWKKSFFLPAMLNGFLSEANSMAQTHTWTKLRMNKKCHWTRDNTPQFNYGGRTYSDGLLVCGKKLALSKLSWVERQGIISQHFYWTGAAIERCLRKKFWGSNCVCSWICEGGVRYTRRNTDFSSLDSHLDFNRASANLL